MPSLASLVDCATRASRRCPRQRASASDDRSFVTRSAPVADHSAERVARDVSWIVRSRSALPSTNSRVVLLSAAVLSKPVLSPRQHEKSQTHATHARTHTAAPRCAAAPLSVASGVAPYRATNLSRESATVAGAAPHVAPRDHKQHRTTPPTTGSDKPSPSPALPNQPTNQPNNRPTNQTATTISKQQQGGKQTPLTVCCVPLQV